jgi:hypothetical protein
MNFTEYYNDDLILEMPYVLIQGKPVDLRMEKKDWVDRFIQYASRLDADEINNMLRPFYEIYKMQFIKLFQNLESEDQRRLLEYLPDEFVRQLGLGQI